MQTCACAEERTRPDAVYECVSNYSIVDPASRETYSVPKGRLELPIPSYREYAPEAYASTNFATSAWWGADERTRTSKPFGTATSRLRVYQFRHVRFELHSTNFPS